MRGGGRREMIRKDNTDLSLTRQCKLLKISRSSIYYTPVGFDQAMVNLMYEIDRIFTKFPFFGSRQIAAYLPQSGFSLGRHRVRRLMGIMELQAIVKGPNTNKKHTHHKIWPHLLRKLSITRPTHVWCSDITYIPVKSGFPYLVAIMYWATGLGCTNTNAITPSSINARQTRHNSTLRKHKKWHEHKPDTPY